MIATATTTRGGGAGRVRACVREGAAAATSVHRSALELEKTANDDVNG